MCQQIEHFICVLSAGDSRRIHSVPHPRAAACCGAGCLVCDGLLKVVCQQIGHFICVLSAGDSRRIHSVPHPRAAACYGAGCSVCDGLIKVVCVSKSDILFVCCLQVTADSFTVYLIPETLRATVLGV